MDPLIKRQLLIGTDQGLEDKFAVKPATKDQALKGGLSNFRDAQPHALAVAHALRELATDVRRIGCGYAADPETIALQKDAIARRLAIIARDIEGAR